MSKVLASLKPYYYYLVGEGIKKIEVRKVEPKSKRWDRDVLFYMSKDEKSFAKIPKELQEKYRKHFGKVGLKYVCDKIIDISVVVRNCNEDCNKVYYNDECKGSCLTWKELQEYGKGKTLYDWHISDLKIYDKPKELSEFRKPCSDKYIKKYKYCQGCKHGLCADLADCWNTVNCPPQSMCYVEI